MKRNNYIHIILSFVVLALFACTNENELLQGEGNEITVTYHPVIETTRAIGDASGIDELIVGVFEGNSHKYTTEPIDWDIAESKGIALTLIEGRQYNIIFWAQNSANTAYKLTKEGKISVNYSDYLEAGFAKMEEMDAFYGVKDITVGSSNATGEVVKLTRPFAQLNFADNTTQPEIGTHKTIVTFHSIASSFNPFTGAVEMSNTDQAFVFTDFPTEKLMVEGSTYYYLSSNYLFTPQTGTVNISATIDVQNTDGTSIKTIELSSITLEQNKKTNVLGAIVQQPEQWSVWDGTTTTPLTTDAENRYIIGSAANVAWLTKNASTLDENKTFVLTNDIDMNSGSLESISLPAGSTIDGGEHIIKGLNLSGALFGDATSLTVKDLVIEDVTISGASSHVGTLVNTLKGSSSFTNVSITNSSVTTTNGAAGGMVGYIVRATEKDRSETLNVSFTGCKLNGVSVSGSASEGKFVGLLSGYDNNESLTFDAECEATDVSVADYKSTYTKANNSAWVNGDVTNKYDGWLGHETYRRAKVTFGGVRMAPRWDGKTATAKADLLLYNGESNKYEVHSPFDLAGVREATASPAALYLMENVDMFGQGSDGEYFVHSNFTKSAFNSTDDNKFNAFSSIALLEGNNKGIYNLALNANGSDRYAFILSGNNGDIHRNISFYDCCTVVPHVVNNNQDKSYGATVVLSVGGATYTMDNIHAYRCKVFALQKTAILAGRLVSSTKATINNCSVNNCYIENYKCQEHEELFEESGLSAKFYSYGEIGGITGFINYNANITNCKVLNTKIHAYHQADKKGSYSGISTPITIPGRHVNQFIGNIRSKSGYTVNVSDCVVCGNSYTQDNDSHSTGSPVAIIGKAYCIGLKFLFWEKGDKEGTVKVKNINIDNSEEFTSETTVKLQKLL